MSLIVPSPRSLGYATDLGLLAANGGVITRREGYTVVRAPGHPGFHWGNFLLMDAPPAAGDEAHWPALFAREFGDDPAIRHIAFGWDHPRNEADEAGEAGEAGLAGDRAGFLALGYEAHDGEVMTTTKLDEPRYPRSDLVIRPLASDADWEAATLAHIASREAGHSLEDYTRFKRRGMGAYRAMAANGHGAWFGAFQGAQLVGDMGLFVTGGLGRFQAVGTAPEARRQGVCATLVYEGARQALATMGVTTLVIVAEPDGEAGRVYTRLGFRVTERQAGICWWAH